MPFHYTNLSQLTAEYAHIYLSPHLDDAALSCGGAISRFAGDAHPVLVVNVCSGSPIAGTAFSAFADQLHQQWNLPPDQAVQRRLREDIEALEILGADSLQLDLLDAIYRVPDAYYDDPTLFGTVADGDPLASSLRAALQELIARCPQAIVYAPLGIGHHVDHQIVAAVAAEFAATGSSVAYYEDFPYVTVADAREQRMQELGGRELFLPVITTIDSALERKISAIAAYASQLDVLFGGVEAMAQAVRTYAATLHHEGAAYGERIWMRR